MSTCRYRSIILKHSMNTQDGAVLKLYQLTLHEGRGVHWRIARILNGCAVEWFDHFKLDRAIERMRQMVRSSV